MPEIGKLFGRLKLNKNITYLGLVSLFTDVSSEMLGAVIPLFLNNVLKVDKSIIGLIEGVAESTASLLKVFSGWISDKTKHRKPWILGGYGLSTLVKPILLVAVNWPTILLYRFLDRIGKGIRTSPRDAVIADFAPAEARGKAFGFHRMMDTIGAVIGPALAFLLMPASASGSFQAASYRPIFLAALVPGILAVLVIVFLVREKEKESKDAKPLPTFRLSNFSPDYIKFIIISVLLNLAVITDAFLILRAQDLGVKAKLIPLILLFFNLIQVSFSLPAGIVSDYLGRRKVIIVGYLIFGATSLGFAYANSPSYVWLLFALNGLFAALTGGVQRAFVVDLVHCDVRGTALGTFNAISGITALPSGLMTGFLWKVYGAKIAFLFGAVLALLGVLAFLALFHKKPEKCTN